MHYHEPLPLNPTTPSEPRSLSQEQLSNARTHVEILYRTVLGLNIVLILYFSRDPTLSCVCVKTESQNIKLSSDQFLLIYNFKTHGKLKHSCKLCVSLFLHLI